MNKPAKHRPSLYFIMLLLVAIGMLLLFELGSFVALRFYVYPRDRSAFYELPEIDQRDYASYRRERHPTLGWPRPSDPDELHFEARAIPSYPTPGGECVATFGDSFTYGDEVEDNEAWSNVLSRSLQCRVANYGVSGYGTDQAYLLFRDLRLNTPRVSILGFLPHNAMRNVNQNRYFITGGNTYGLKPRFTLTGDGGGLTHIPIPDLGYDDFVDSFAKPEAYLAHETFTPSSEYGPIVLSFPYSRAFIKYVMSERVRMYIGGWPGWRGFVSEGHSSHALEVTAGIFDLFARTAQSRNQTALVLMFPTARSYDAFLSKGEIAYQPLLDRLESIGVSVLDLHDPIREYLGDRRICHLLTDVASCSGHFNAEGNELVAAAVYTKITEDGLLAASD